MQNSFCDLCLKVEAFNLKYTLECGQCFRWEKLEENVYVGVIEDRVLKVKQEGDMLQFWSNKKEDLEQVVKEYFDLNRDYTALEKNISKVDKFVETAVKYSSGIRILNQPLFETYVSYIISANNNIKRISRSVNDISKMYGKKVQFEGHDYYLFPTLEEMSKCTVEELLKCGLGFRAKYVVQNTKTLNENRDSLFEIKNMPTADAKKRLMDFMGIGPKVADCILLFSLKRGEVFPVDVWVKRIMEKLYFKKNVELKEISKFAHNLYGENAGIIQQHLFYNVREGKM